MKVGTLWGQEKAAPRNPLKNKGGKLMKLLDNDLIKEICKGFENIKPQEDIGRPLILPLTLQGNKAA